MDEGAGRTQDVPEEDFVGVRYTEISPSLGRFTERDDDIPGLDARLLVWRAFDRGGEDGDLLAPALDPDDSAFKEKASG